MREEQRTAEIGTERQGDAIISLAVAIIGAIAKAFIVNPGVNCMARRAGRQRISDRV